MTYALAVTYNVAPTHWTDSDGNGAACVADHSPFDAYIDSTGNRGKPNQRKLLAIREECTEICLSCPIFTQCREWVLADEAGTSWKARLRNGYIAGMTPFERAGTDDSPRTRRRLAIDHGTAAGYRAHYRREEKPCEECLKAGHNAEASARRRRAKAKSEAARATVGGGIKGRRAS